MSTRLIKIASPTHFFDTRDGDHFVPDDDGAELPDLDAAKRVASVSLAELARGVIPSSDRRVLMIEVREERQPVMEARLAFEAIALVH